MTYTFSMITTRTRVHRNHHFDTIQRLHPLLHPLNTGDAPSLHPDIRLDYSSFLEKMLSSLFVHEKRDITALGCNISFLLLLFTCQASNRQTESFMCSKLEIVNMLLLFRIIYFTRIQKSTHTNFCNIFHEFTI